MNVSTVPLVKVESELPSSLALENPTQPAVVQMLWLVKDAETEVMVLLALNVVALDPLLEDGNALSSEDPIEVLDTIDVDDWLELESVEFVIEVPDETLIVEVEVPLTKTEERLEDDRELVGLDELTEAGAKEVDEPDSELLLRVEREDADENEAVPLSGAPVKEGVGIPPELEDDIDTELLRDEGEDADENEAVPLSGAPVNEGVGIPPELNEVAEPEDTEIVVDEGDDCNDTGEEASVESEGVDDDTDDEAIEDSDTVRVGADV